MRTGTDPVIRKAVAEDADAISACVVAAYRHYIERMGKPPGPMLDDYQQVILQHEVFVAETSILIGVLVLIRSNSGILLDNLAVRPAYQNHGLGRRLVRLAESEALAMGYDAINLYTHECMTENLAYYRSMGYEETGRRQENGYDRIYLRKALSGPGSP